VVKALSPKQILPKKKNHTTGGNALVPEKVELNKSYIITNISRYP